MKVFDLQCAREHRFEGWFASADAYDTQREKGLLQCPMCGSSSVQRLPSAPHLNVSSLRAEPLPSSSGAMQEAMARREGAGIEVRERAEQQARLANQGGLRDVGAGAGVMPRGQKSLASVDGTPEAKLAEALQAAWLKMAREVIRQTENVGDQFADEARRIHYDEAPARAIRGHATAEQVAELADEGIDVLPLPMPDAAKETLQ